MQLRQQRDAAPVYGEVLGEGGFGRVYKITHGGQKLARKAFFAGCEGSCQAEYNVSVVLRNTMCELEKTSGGNHATDMVSTRKHYARLALAIRMAHDTTPIGHSALDFELAECDLARVAFRNPDNVQQVHREPIGCPQLACATAVYDVVADCLGGLVFIHDLARVIHKDIKPANLLLFNNCKVKIADFGIAHLYTGTNVYEGSENLGVGTVQYQAPEIWHGTGNAKVDIFAMGVALYEVFEGVSLIELNTSINDKFAAWQTAVNKRCKNAADMERAFVDAMREWHADRANSKPLTKLAAGRNLRSFAYMHDAVPAVLRRMMAKRPQDRPTAREALLLLTCSSQRITANVGTNTEKKQGVDTSAGSSTPLPAELLGRASAQPDTSDIRNGETSVTAAMDVQAIDALFEMNGGSGLTLDGGLTLALQAVNGGQLYSAGGTAETTTPHQADDDEWFDAPSGDESVETATSAVGPALRGVKRKHSCDLLKGDVTDDEAKAACLVIKKAKHQFAYYQSKAHTKVVCNMSQALVDKHVDKLLAKLKRKGDVLHLTAQRILTKARSANTAMPVSREELMLLAALKDEGCCSTGKGVVNPARLLFKLCSQRSENWWNKNSKKLLKALEEKPMGGSTNSQ